VNNDSIFQERTDILHESHIVPWRCLVIRDKEGFVNPVSENERETTDGVQDWHSRRVDERHEDVCQHGRVTELHQELWAQIQCIIVFLQLLLCVLPVTTTSSITATFKTHKTRKTEVSQVRREYSQNHCQ